MAQSTPTVDPDFVEPLKTNVTGIYFTEVARFTPEQIEQEFRNAMQDPTLAADNRFLYNLMFLVRKREVRALLPDVEQRLNRGGLGQEAEVSALKTLYALGSPRERALADDRLSRALAAAMQGGEDLTRSHYLDAAERIGGPQTLEVLRRGTLEWRALQQQAATARPPDPVRVARLDRVRSAFDDKSFILARKLQILALPETERAAQMTELFLQHAAHMSFWSHKELLDHPSPAAVQGVFAFVVQRAHTLLPVSGLTPEQQSLMLLHYRLRGLCLVQAMGAPLGAAEQKYLADHAQLIQDNEEFFRPRYDWEDVLDVI